MTDEVKAVETVVANAVKAEEAAVHVATESWLSAHKWPIMLALFCVVVVVVGLFVIK